MLAEKERESKARCLLIGYLEADDAFYELEREKIVVFNGTSPSKYEEDDMKNIRQTKSGVWQFRKKIEGKEYSFSNKLKTKVIEFKRDFEKRLKTKGSEKLISETIKFNDFAKKFFETYRRRKVGKRTI